MSASILVIDDERVIRETLQWCLSREGHRVVTAESGEAALTLLEQAPFDLAVADIVMPGIDGLEFLQRARELAPPMPVILITAYATVETAVEALRRGAVDYFVKPFRLDDLRARIEQALRDSAAGRRPGPAPRPAPELVGRSAAIQALRQRIGRVAPAASPVLVLGETGAGKELVARAIHAASPRRARPFVAANCGAIPDGLFESTLFGHMRGAFTGAVRANPGLMVAAHGGTLFLDEVGELPPHLQVKLLRAIEDQEVWPVGATAPVRVDCRIVAATQRDLARAVAAGSFREDLDYRLSVVRIVVPPLRERREDLPLLIDHFVPRLNAKLGTSFRGVEPAAFRALLGYDWPGNVRGLAHVLESAMLAGQGDLIGLADLPAELRSEPPAMSLREATRRFERQYILTVLAETRDKREAARQLRVSLASLYRKLGRTAS